MSVSKKVFKYSVTIELESDEELSEDTLDLLESMAHNFPDEVLENEDGNEIDIRTGNVAIDEC